MKKTCIRLVGLTVLATAVLLLVNTDRVTAFDCVSLSAMFDAQGTCDDNYWTGASPYHDLINHNPNHCTDDADNAASNGCSDPSCYSIVWASTYNACVSSAVSDFQTAGNNYSNCLYSSENPTCFERVDFCDAARARASACEALANDDCCAYSECLNASGIWSCE